MINKIKLRMVSAVHLIVGLLIMLLALAASPASGADPKEELEKKGIMFTADSFIESAKKGDLVAVKLFLDGGINVNAREGGYEETALLKAAKAGYSEVVKLLLDHKADVNADFEMGDYWTTPLISAAQSGDLGVVRMLLAHGAKSDKNVLSVALLRATKHPQMVRFLLEKGADSNVDDGYYTALMNAVGDGSIESVRLLVKHGAKMGVEKDGKIALTVAVDKGQIEIVKFLISKGANVNAKSRLYKDTALMNAIASGRPDMVKLLLENGANINKTVLDIAKEKKNSEIVKLLKSGGKNLQSGK